MTIHLKTVPLQHILTFTAGVLSGGYIEEIDLFLDDDGYVLGKSDTRKTDIEPRYLSKWADTLNLVYTAPSPETNPPTASKTMPDIVHVIKNDNVTMSEIPVSQPVPDYTYIVTVDDLNGKFAPQDGNIQPEIATIPTPVQVDVVHPADDSTKPLVAIIDDWAAAAAAATQELLARAAYDDSIDPAYLPQDSVKDDAHSTVKPIAALEVVADTPEVGKDEHSAPEVHPEPLPTVSEPIAPATVAHEVEANAEANDAEVVIEPVKKSRKARSSKSTIRPEVVKLPPIGDNDLDL